MENRSRKAKDVDSGSQPKSKRLQAQANEAIEEEKKVKKNEEHLKEWKTAGTILYGDFGTEPSKKIAGFDMDSTLIETKSGKTFAQSPSDWKWWHSSVPEKLKEAHEDGFKIVIFSNQAGVSTGKTTAGGLKSKFIQIHKALNIPFQALCATESDVNRKAGTGMWKYFVKNCNGETVPDLKESFYCGDAAGRPKTKNRKKDFSDSDRKFAINVGIDFKTPEMYFLDQKEKLPPLAFTMRKFKDMEGESPIEDEKEFKSEEQEMIVFVGAPGAGKSTFWSEHFSDYVRVNNDTLKTAAKCMKVAREALKDGKSCIIDNTNPDSDTRSRYTKIAEEFEVPCRAFFFDIDKSICMHNNEQRKKNPGRKHFSKKVGNVIIHTFFKRVQKPTTDEGFSEVKTVRFVPGPFKNSTDEECYYNG